jgi:hypothetical protein
VGIPSAEAFGLPTVLRQALFPEGATIEDYQRALMILQAAQREADPAATLASDLPTQAPLFAGLVDLVKTPAGLVQIADAIASILGLLIMLAQCEAPPVIVQLPAPPPVIVQAPDRPDITVVVPDDHQRVDEPEGAPARPQGESRS